MSNTDMNIALARIDALIERIRVANTRHGRLSNNGHERIGLVEHVRKLITEDQDVN